ncbi:MAG: helix-turn-helix transcriptional regulator [Chthonomonas sp.]|nr:helix-turn-helix transcriptional regulator [Chthonomonas sp.]
MTDDAFFALADPVRREIVRRLSDQGPTPTLRLLDGLGSTRQGATRHLTVLERSGLVISERKGREIVRRLDAQPLAEMLAWLGELDRQWQMRLNRLAEQYDA